MTDRIPGPCSYCSSADHWRPDCPTLKVQVGPDSGAQFSPCRTWRYALWRKWAQPVEPRYCVFIGLNPSTADEVDNDPTVRRCIGYARAWDFDGLYMMNIFAFRATDPQDMRAADDPVGPQNDAALRLVCHSPYTRMVVAAWGVHGAYRERGQAVLALLQDCRLRCLGVTKAGHPKHPLYLRKDLQPVILQEAHRGGPDVQ